MSFRAYSYTKVPIGTTQVHYTYFTDTEVPGGTTGLILILSIREYPLVLQRFYLFYRYGSTRRYYWTYTYFIDTGVPVSTTEQIQRYIQIFTLILYSESYHITV